MYEPGSFGDEDEEGLARKAAIWVLEIFPGVLSPVVLILSIIVLAISALVMWLGLSIFALGGLITCFWIGGAGVLLFWTALSWIMYGHLANPVEALAEFEGKHWTVFTFLTGLLVVAFVLLAKAAA